MRKRRSIATLTVAGICMTSLLQLPAGANDVNASLAKQPVSAFAKMNLQQAESDELSDTITTIVGSVYDVIPTEVEVKLEGSSDLTLSAEPVPAREIAHSIDDEIDLSVAAQTDVEEMAYAVATEHDPSNLPDGIEPNIVQNVEVSDTTIEATKDLTDGSLIVESQTLVKKTYETGVVGQSLVEPIAIFDEDGEIISFKELTSEDYANQANIDSGTTAIPYENDPGSSEYGVPLDLSNVSEESDNDSINVPSAQEIEASTDHH